MDFATVKRGEVLRYMGCKGEVPPEVLNLAEECLAMLGEVCEPRYVVREFPLKMPGDGVIETDCFRTVSRNLEKNLKDCHKLLVFAATLGIGVDHLIRRYNRLDMSRTVALQAGAAAVLEEYCDQVCRKLREDYERQGFYLRPRFSPGYGDFPLEAQPSIVRTLRADIRLGLTVLPTHLLLPTKSITAVLGLFDVLPSRHEENEACASCALRATCEMRKRGVVCHGRTRT